jgi:hypothetical protein
MHSESLNRNISYKLRELELILKQLCTGDEYSRIDIDLALEKTRQLYDILIEIAEKHSGQPAREKKHIPTGIPVVPADPDPVEDDRVYEAEDIIASNFMDKNGRGQEHDTGQEKTENRHNPPGNSEQERKAPPETRDQERKAPPETRDQERKAPPGNSEQERKTPPETRGQERESPPETSEQERKVPPETSEQERKAPPGNSEQERKAPPEREAGGDVTPPRASATQTKEPEIEILAHKYQSSQNYINQAIASKQTKKDLTTKLQSKPISDLRNSIGLNEKFLFIKDLFKGRLDQYNECIDDLNNSASYGDAMVLIRDKYSLDENNEVVRKLADLVKRKHRAE